MSSRLTTSDRLSRLVALPQIPVVQGATTSEPDGTLAWSSTLGQTIVARGGTWRTLAPSLGLSVAVALGNITP